MSIHGLYHQGHWTPPDTQDRAELQGSVSVLSQGRMGSCSPLPSTHSRKGPGPGLPALTHVIGSPILPLVLIHLALLLGNLVENGSLFSEPP